MRVAVDRLHRAAGGLSQTELSEEVDVGRWLEAIGDRDEVVCVEEWQFTVVAGQCVVDGAKTFACRHRLYFAARPHVLPEGDDMAAVPVRTGIEQVGRRHDRRPSA